MAISGTREWASKTVNCVTGCSHNCRYCYARWNAVDRFKRVKREDWITEVVREADVKRLRHKVDGTIMFPTTHDISPAILEPCIAVLGKLLSVGNDVLIVSKPHLPCIKAICEKFASYKGKILFRFTIGALDDAILSFWEPGAPKFAERLDCLKLAYCSGFKTSVSAEPLLEPWSAVKMYETLVPFINDALWIGKLNKPELRLKMETDKEQAMLANLVSWQKDEEVKKIYESLKDKPHMKWKESYKAVVGLKLSDEAGLDE